MNNDRPNWHVPKVKAYQRKIRTDQKFYAVMSPDGEIYPDTKHVNFNMVVDSARYKECKLNGREPSEKYSWSTLCSMGWEVIPVKQIFVPDDGSKVVVDREKWESMIDAVKKLEYSGRTIVRKSCPICDYVEGDGHAMACEIGDALKRLDDDK